MSILSSVPIWVILLIITIVVVSIGVMVITYLRDRTLEQIRADVYQLILKAEHMYSESSSGKQKMKWVVQSARLLLPGWVQAIVFEEVLMDIIQTWFDGVKDLLDDGKMNSSQSK